MRHHLLFTSSIITLALACDVYAVVAAPASGADSPPAAQVEEVVVTGSRITRQDYTSNTPIVTVGAAALEKSGAVTLDTVLKQQPQFVASTGATTNSNGNGGQANIQLRGLGRQRTLVLMDGRRLPPANSDGSPDINAVPTALIQNVEIITGGASAVYGSDAIAGVVNILMKKKFDGIEVSAQYGVAGEGDAADYKLAVTGGGAFNDGRGSAVFSAEYANRKPILVSDRAWTYGASRDSVLPSGLVTFASGPPSQAALDQVFASYGVPAGTVRSGNQFGFNNDGTLYTTGLTIQNFRGSRDPAQYTFLPTQILAEGRHQRYLQLPLERYSFYNRLSYDLTDTTHVFAQFMYTNNVASIQLNANPSGSSATTGVPLIPVTNPFIPADLRTLLASRANPTAPIAFSKRFDEFGPRRAESRNNTFQLVAGVDGRLPVSDWTYGVSASYGKNSILTVRPNWQSRAALQALLIAPDGGASLCTGGYNPFGSLPTSASCATFINKRLKSNVEIEQRIVEANLQGGLFTLPAGKLRFALGADYREDYFLTEPDPLIAAGDILGNVSGSFFEGTTDVKEAYAELLVPLLADLPFAQDVSADLGYRLSDYSSVGRVQTYKADLSWQVIKPVTFRGGYERAIRAPNIGELSSPVVGTFAIIGLAGSFGSGDPCDVTGAYRRGPNAAQVRALCVATGVPGGLVDTFRYLPQSAFVASGGNPNLTEETANTFSAGVVLKPDFSNPLIENLSLSVDYYNIEVKNAVGSITATQVLSRCFNADGRSNPTFDAANPFCVLTSRTAEGNLERVSQQLLNLGGYKTSGVDLQVDWRFPTSALGLPDNGDVSVNLVTSYLETFQVMSLPGDPFSEFAGTIGNGQIDPVALSRPKAKGNLDIGYKREGFSAGLTWRYIGKMDNAANVGTGGTSPGVKAVSYFDINTRYRFSDHLEVWGVIANLADTKPPAYPASGSTDLATYDAIGRRFTVGVKSRF